MAGQIRDGLSDARAQQSIEPNRHMDERMEERMKQITSAIRRQMTDEGARVTADRDEFCAVCDAVDAIHARKLRALDASTARVDELCRENERLRELVRDMFYAVHPADREKFLTNVAELGVDE